MVTTYPWTGAATKSTEKKYPWTGAAGITPTTQPATATQPTTGGMPPVGFSPFGPTMGMEASIQAAQKAEDYTPIGQPFTVYPHDLGFTTGGGSETYTYNVTSEEQAQQILKDINQRDIDAGREVTPRWYKYNPKTQVATIGTPSQRTLDLGVDLTFGISPDGDKIVVYVDDKKIGTATPETGEVDDAVIEYLRGHFLKAAHEVSPQAYAAGYGKLDIPVYGAIMNFLTRRRIDSKTGEVAPAIVEILGVTGLIGSLSVMGYQGITALQQVGWSGVRKELLTPFKSILDTYIKHNAKDIALLAQRVPSSLSGKQKILQNIYNFHNEYMARRAREIAAAQLQARMGRVPTVNIEQEVKYLTSATQTTDKLATAINKGTALTTTNVQGLVVSGTPTEFTQGINAIISGQAISAVTGEGIPMPAGVQQEFLARAETWLQQVPEVKPNDLHIVGISEGEAFIRTDSGGNPLVVGTSLIREGQLTLSTIVADQSKSQIAIGKALIDVGNYIKANNIAFPPREEMSPDAIKVYDKLVAKGEVPEYAPTTAMAEWGTKAAPITKENIPLVINEYRNLLARKEAELARTKLFAPKETSQIAAQERRIEFLQDSISDLESQSLAMTEGETVTGGERVTTAMAKWGTVSGNIDEMEAELAGLQESLSIEPAAKLVNLVKKLGEYKGEITDFTLKQYRDITGKTQIEPSILTKDKKHVRWEYALDEIAEDMGYESEEALKKAIEGAVRTRARIRGLQSAIAEVEVAPSGIVPPAKPADVKKLRQSIMATVKTKGLSESKYRALFKKVGGTRNLTEMGADKLQSVLDAVWEARPIKIHGKNVITAKTEKAIQTLKDILIAEKKLTPEIYENLKKYLDLPTDKYESRELFITERQAHSLLRQMNVEAEVGITGWDVRVAEGLANKPKLKTSINTLTSRVVSENKPKPKKNIAIPFRKVASEISEYPNDVGLSGTMSILRALRRFQEQLGGREVTRIYENAEMMVEQRRLNEITLANTVNAMKMEVPQLATIIKDKTKMARIQQWLDSDLKFAKVEKPELTADELEVAQLFRARYDQWKNAVRLERFKDAYFHYGGRAKESVAELIKNGTEGTSDVAIPDAPLKDIKEAIEIYGTQGETALKAYLDTKDWGVLKSGYSFSQILHPKLRMYKGTSVRATTTSLHQRKGLDFLRDERTAWERLIAYERQMIGLNLQPYYRKMDMEFRKIVESGKISPESARDAANKISLFMREVKGYPIESPVISLLLRIGGWSFGTLAKVPWMSVRNLHQNIAFHPDKTEIVKSFFGRGFFSNPLTKRGRLDYTDALVHQYKGVQQEQILMGYMGKTPIENLIRKTDYYHLSDKANRYMSMNGSGAKAERALKQYLKDGNVEKFLKNSGANELSATEQVRILEYLALETYDYGGVLSSVSGGEAAIRDIASRITTLNHFNYVRYLRSTMEMGETGRIIGSLVAFPRSVAERYIDIFSRIKRLGGADRKRAIHALIAMVVGSAIASALLKEITGKERDAYNPLLVLQWQVGGLAIGATQNLMELYRLMTNLTFAEDEGQKKYYFDEIITLVPQLGDSFIPFYAVTMNLLESLTDSKYLDRKQLRKLRELFDENYELNEEFYQVERDWLEKVQHGLFGSNTPDPTDLEAALKKLQGTEDILGQVDTEAFDKAKQKAEEDNKPFEYTEDDFIYRTNDLGSDISSAVYGLDPSEIIAENGFSSLVLQYLEYQELKDDYFDVPADKRYDYREKNPETDANLFFWSYVVTLQSEEAKQIVSQMISRFGVPSSSIRGYDQAFGTQAGGRYPWSSGTTGGGKYPWTGYSSK